MVAYNGFPSKQQLINYQILSLLNNIWIVDWYKWLLNKYHKKLLNHAWFSWIFIFNIININIYITVTNINFYFLLVFHKSCIVPFLLFGLPVYLYILLKICFLPMINIFHEPTMEPNKPPEIKNECDRHIIWYFAILQQKIYEWLFKKH